LLVMRLFRKLFYLCFKIYEQSSLLSKGIGAIL